MIFIMEYAWAFTLFSEETDQKLHYEIIYSDVGIRYPNI